MDFQLKKELLETQKKWQARREEAQSLQLQQQGSYVYQHSTKEQAFTLVEKSAYTRKHLDNVRNLVSEYMPGAYEHIDKIREADHVDQRAAILHYSRGKRYLNNGANVLEFDIAGSGFKQFRAVHKGFHGKRVVDEQGEKEEFKKQLRKSWFNRAFSWLPGVRSEKEIDEENARRQKSADKIKAKYQMDLGNNSLGSYRQVRAANKRLKAAQERAVDEHYGERPFEKMKHIHKKVTERGRKTRITMAGPLAMWGASNSGDYSIENLRKYMLQMGSEYLESIFGRWQRPEDEHDINLILRGHSRGGVAAAEGAMMIKYWVKENYPQYMNRVKFDLIQYDPVPGFGSYSEHALVNHEETDRAKSDRLKMEPLGKNAETTVLYSMHTEHSFFFTPQVIKGAKRVILTPFKHSLDLGTADRTQAEAHRRGFAHAQTGELYRSSGINDLDRGVYLVNEQNEIVRMDNYAQVERIVKEYVKNAKFQGERHKILLDVARTWFENEQQRD